MNRLKFTPTEVSKTICDTNCAIHANIALPFSASTQEIVGVGVNYSERLSCDLSWVEVYPL